MKGSDIISNYENCQIFESMLSGLNRLIMNAPSNEKKDMLKDVIKLGGKIAKNYRSHLNSNEYLEVQITSLEIALKKAEHEAEYNRIMLERFRKGV